MSDRTYRIAAAVDRVWDALTSVAEYPTWWPWLREFDASELAPGAQWRCAVRPPLPYTVRFTVSLVDVVEHEAIFSHVHGDVSGDAIVRFAAAGDACDVRLVSRLAPTGRGLAVLAVLAMPVAARAHDWILDTGAKQFAERAV